MRCKSSELKKLVFLEAFGETDVVEVVEAVDGIAEGLVILFLNQEVIVRIVDSFDVELR